MLKKIMIIHGLYAALALVMPAIVAMEGTGAGAGTSLSSKNSSNSSKEAMSNRLMAMSTKELQDLVDSYEKFIKEIDGKLKELEKDNNQWKHQLDKWAVEYFLVMEQKLEILSQDNKTFRDVFVQCVALKKMVRQIKAHSQYKSLMALGLDDDYCEEVVDGAAMPPEGNTIDIWAKETEFREQAKELAALSRQAEEKRRLEREREEGEQLYRANKAAQKTLLIDAAQTVRVIAEKTKREHLDCGRFDEREKAGFEKMRNALVLVATERALTGKIKQQAQEFYDTMTQFKQSRIGQFCFASEANEQECRRAAQEECAQEEATAQPQNPRAPRLEQPAGQPGGDRREVPVRRTEPRVQLASPGGKGPKGPSWWKVAAGAGITIGIAWGLKKWYESNNKQSAGK